MSSRPVWTCRVALGDWSQIRTTSAERIRKGFRLLRSISRISLASLVTSASLATVAVILSMYLSVNHISQTESSAALCAAGAFLSFVYLSAAMEWYLPPRTVGRSKLGVVALFSTGLMVVGIGYWVDLVILSLSNPISPDPSFYNGMYISMIGGFSLFLTDMMRAAKHGRQV